MSTIQQDTIEDRVKTIIAQQFCRSADEIDLTADMASTFQCDSLDLVEITMCVEDEFGIEIDDHEMYAMKTGRQIVDHVRGKV
ncbi:acyl carrier protein [Burkholderia cepacia]|uniref:acyl carrier protein n=1 Tax=Burkholderia cepacia TaxID=292 RepID=UPI00075E893D|nr:phosphopantetheine-binding protein [Burkholderia cepacia]KWF90356.1 hypothetical protein WL95_27390 [Burkholderia cepacia]